MRRDSGVIRVSREKKESVASAVLLDFLDFRGSGAVLEAEDRRATEASQATRGTTERMD